MLTEHERRCVAAKLRQLTAAFSGEEPPEIASAYLASMTSGRQMFAGTAAVALNADYIQLPSGLYVPGEVAGPAQPLDTITVYLTYEELAGSKLPLPAILGLLRKLSRSEVLTFAAKWLGAVGAPGASWHKLDAAYLTLFDGDVRELVSNVTRSRNMRLVVRQSLLVLAKLALLNCGNDTASDVDLTEALPLLPLAVADHLGAEVGDYDGVDRYVGASSLTPEIMSNQHFNSPDDPAHVTGRWVRQWRQLPTEFPDARLGDLGSLYYEATGATLDDVATIALTMWSSAAHGRPVLERDALGRLGIPPERVSAVLRLVGASAPDTFAALREDVNRTGMSGLRWEFSAFGRHPVVCFDDGVLVVDPTLLVERAFGWLPYFDIEGYLRSRGDSRLGTFRRVVRLHAERYVLEVLRSMAPTAGGQRRLYAEADLKAAFGGKGVQIADAAIDYGDVWVVLEVTTRRLVRDTVAGLSREALAGDIRALAIAKSAQIASTIDQLRHGEARLTGHVAPAGRRFIPVIVATEGFPVNPVSTTLVEERLVAAGLLQAADVLPLQILDVSELERVEGLQEAGGPSLAALLLDKPNGRFAKTSLRDYMLVERQLRAPRPQRLNKLWPQPFLTAQSAASPAA